MAQWIGYMVSIKCADNLGTYQGQISAATNTKITLTKAFCDGFPCDGPVQLSAANIVDLKLLDKQIEKPEETSTVTVSKPLSKRGRSQSTSEPSASKQLNHNNRSKPIDIDLTKQFNESVSFYNRNTPNKRERPKGGKWVKGWKDEECFGFPLDFQINKEFDFEKNLALFDKQALWEELNTHKPDVVHNTDSRKITKYRHDENIIVNNNPMSSRQIIVPKQEFCEYVTDDGLIIPSISRNLRKKLFDAADKVGMSFEKRVELFGTAAAELAIHLLGGGHRLNPSNSHQLPTVVVLCGPHKQGAAGINTARQLASHGVRTIVFCVSLEASSIKKELALYALTRNATITMASDLPSTADLIICALCEDTDSPKTYQALSEWAKKNRAPVLALDPPSCGTPGFLAKISLLPVLPLPQSPKNGKLYLANLGIPVDIFDEVGIQYKSPFGPKNTISLHPHK